MDFPVSRKIILVISACFVLITLTAAVILNDIPTRDAAFRYCPAAEAFAAGQWMYAFHPRVPILHTFTSGIAAFIFECSGFMAAKISSALWHIAGIVLLFFIMRDVYGKKSCKAEIGVMIYAVFPYAFHAAYSGLRESAKSFCLLLTAWALIKICRRYKQMSAYILLGIGCGLGMITRIDLVLTGLFCIFAGGVLESVESKKFPVRIIPALITAFIPVLVNTTFNFIINGTAVFDIRIANVLMKLSGSRPGFTDIFIMIAILAILIPTASLLMAKLLTRIHIGYFVAAVIIFLAGLSIFTALTQDTSSAEQFPPMDFISSIWTGFYHVIAMISLIHIAVSLTEKNFTRPEFMLLTVVVANTISNIFPILVFEQKLYVSSRYLYPAVPLLFGFFICGIEEIYVFCRDKIKIPKTPAVAALMLTVLAGLFIFHMFQPLSRSYFGRRGSRERKAIHALAELLRNDYRGAETSKTDFDPGTYLSMKAPKIWSPSSSKFLTAAYLAGGTQTFSPETADYFLQHVGEDIMPESSAKISKTGEIFAGKKHFILWRVIK